MKRRRVNGGKWRVWLVAMLGLSASGVGGEPIEGRVVAVEAAALRVTVDTGTAEHGVVEALVGRGDAQVLQPGMAIRGDLVPQGAQLRLQTIWPNDPAARGTIANMGAALRRDTLQRGSKAFRGVGEFLPKFALYDEDGALFLSDQLRGKYAVINFIFTRCANMQMCPASTQRMKELKALAEQEGLKSVLTLVSITLDPAYDTPGIFTAYAMDKGIETDTFHFLGGPAQIVDDLKVQLGVLAEPDEKEIIRHTMSTALVDPTGKIIYRIPGSMWAPEAFVNKLKAHKAEAR